MPAGYKESESSPMEGVESTSKAAKVEDETPESQPSRAPKTKPTPAPAQQPVETSAEDDEKKKALEAKARGAEAYKQRDFATAILTRPGSRVL
jgi:hypothetical protein